MILPTDDECRRVLDILEDDPELTEWEFDFIASNKGRTEFTAGQKEVVARLKEKYACG
jgi:hypothetical protein